MSIHNSVNNKGIYFVTYTCHKWLPLIQKTNCYDFIYKSFDVLRKRNHDVLGYVIMPNHLHLLLYYDGSKRLKSAKESALLDQLKKDVQEKDKSRGKLHEVWQDSFECKECRTEAFILQKLNYIHNNPCSGKWKLADNLLHYPYSSAGFYINGKTGLYPVTDYRNKLVLLQEEIDKQITDESSGFITKARKE